MWQWLGSRKFNRSTIVLLGCLAFLAGLVAARWQADFAPWFVSAVAVCALLAIRHKPRSLVVLLLVVATGFALGGWRGAGYVERLQPYQALAQQKVTLTGTASIDAVYGKNGQLSFAVRGVTFQQPYVQEVPGAIKVAGFGVPMVYEGDTVQVTGKLYLTRGGSQASIGYAQLQVLEANPSAIDDLRRQFAAGMQSALPEPAASFGLGLLVGQRNTLPVEISDALLMVGLTHIIAVSGYNLTILLEAARRLMGNRSKLLSVAIALGLIGTFLLITGGSASIVRASVIAVLGLTAWYYGRTVRPVVLIAVAASLTAYANPVYLWSDISWYLSFLAFFGVLVLAPYIIRRMYGKKQPPLLKQIVIETLCAEIMTIPIVLYIFGQTSLVGLVANVLVVALIPIAMLLSLVAGLAGMLVPTVAGWFAWPANLLLTYMLDTAQLLSRLPYAFQENRYISAVDMVACYALVLGVLWLFVRRQKRLTDWQTMVSSLRPKP
jgi:competence protein ComEC